MSKTESEKAYAREYYRRRIASDEEFRRQNIERARAWDAAHRDDPVYKEQKRASAARWRKANPDKVKAAHEKRQADGRSQAHRYNLSAEELRARKVRQQGRCFICGITCVLCVDHNHETEVVRELLCDFCNRTVGLVEKRRALVEAAIVYLDAHR